MPENLSFFEYSKILGESRRETFSHGKIFLTSENCPEVYSLSVKYNLNLPKISILPSKTPQAYAWPSLGVTRGLINILNGKELFATILHEIGHRKTRWRFFDYFIIPLYFSGLFYLTVLILMEFTVWNFLSLIIFRILLSPMICAVQRKIEFIADSYAADTLGADSEWLGQAIKKTHGLIKKDIPIFDKLINYFAFWPFKTHPPVDERLESLNKAISR
jgi:Zn-dependent protease with chaperone function